MVDQTQSAAPGLVTVVFDLPVVSGGGGRPPEARLHLDHYHRLQAIEAAAASGNALLLKLAIEHQAKFGSRPEEGY